VLAAGGLGTTLLAGPALGRNSPGGVPIAALIVALVGLLGALCGAGYLLTTPGLPTKVDPQALVQAFERQRELDDLDAFYRTMIGGLGAMRQRGDRELRRLHRVFTYMLCGILVELCGLALAAAVA